MKFRFHRGSLADSMATVQEISGRDALTALLSEEIGIDPGSHVQIKPYGYDKRIDWNTFIVTVDGFGVVGFTDGSIE